MAIPSISEKEIMKKVDLQKILELVDSGVCNGYKKVNEAIEALSRYYAIRI